MDRLRALEVFIEVADAGSLAGAARKLSLSAPTVTRVLSEFERELGVLLFLRTTRAVTLTEPGRAFLEDARRIVSHYQEASDAVRGAHRAPTGLLRVTAPTMLGQYYVLPILTQFLDQFDGVKVEAIFLDRVVNIVEEGFDLAVRIGSLPDSSLIATRVGTVRRVVCGCDAYFEQHGIPQKPADLINHKIISAVSVSTKSEWRFKDGESAKVNPRLFLSSIPAAIDAAKSGWGLTQVLSYQIGPALGDGVLKTILSDYEPAPMPIHLVHAEGHAASAKVRTFIDMARGIIRNDRYLNG